MYFIVWAGAASAAQSSLDLPLFVADDDHGLGDIHPTTQGAHISSSIYCTYHSGGLRLLLAFIYCFCPVFCPFWQP